MPTTNRVRQTGQGPGAGEDRAGHHAEAAEEGAAQAGERVLGTARGLLQQAQPLGDQLGRLGQRLEHLRARRAAPAGARFCGLNWCAEDRVGVLLRDRGHVEARASGSGPTPSKVTSALTISTISTGKYMRCCAPRLTERMMSCASEKSRKLAAAVPALEDLGDLAAEPVRVGARARAGDGRQVARRALGVAHHQRVVVVEERAPQVARRSGPPCRGR